MLLANIDLSGYKILTNLDNLLGSSYGRNWYNLKLFLWIPRITIVHGKLLKPF
mgnify:CR=1 FL=1